MSEKRLRVAVLFGGRSSEHEVSLLTAHSVIHALDKKAFDVVPLGIDREGHYFLHTLDQLASSDNQPLAFHPDAEPIPFTREAICDVADIIFPALHGEFYEDGCLQGSLELLGLPYIGSGVAGSAIAMDKSISKHLVKALGIPTAPWLDISRQAWNDAPSRLTSDILQALALPVFVKPMSAGSSVGIIKVRTQADLSFAIDHAFLYDTRIIVEKALDARDIEVSVLENIDDVTKPLVSLPGEVKPNDDFYSYAAKYDDEVGAQFDLPARLPDDIVKNIQHDAARIFRQLLCQGMARVDFLVERGTNECYFNEANTLPGFTSISLYPKLWALSGLAYPDLLTKLIHLALARFDKRRALSHAYEVPHATSK